MGRIRFEGRAGLALAVAGLLLAGGCEKRVVGTSLAGRGGPPPAEASGAGGQGGSTSFFGGGGSSAGGSAGQSQMQWAIALGRFQGTGHNQQAERAKRRLANQTGMEDLWVQAEGPDRSMLYYGRYPSSSDPEAQKDLARWRKLQKSGRVRLPVLMLSPVGDLNSEGGGSSRSAGRYNLRNAADRGIYTLQVAFYDQRFGDNFRKAAETAAKKLRQEGHEAFYYHGANRSMVTVGVFGPDAVRAGQGGRSRYSRRVKQLQKEFSYNLANGRVLKVKGDGGEQKQPSFLVRIPGGREGTVPSGAGDAPSQRGGSSTGGAGILPGR